MEAGSDAFPPRPDYHPPDWASDLSPSRTAPFQMHIRVGTAPALPTNSH